MLKESMMQLNIMGERGGKSDGVEETETVSSERVESWSLGVDDDLVMGGEGEGGGGGGGGGGLMMMVVVMKREAE